MVGARRDGPYEPKKGDKHDQRVEELKARYDYIDLVTLQERFGTSYDVWYNMTDDRPKGKRRYEPVLPSLRIGEKKAVKISDLIRLLNVNCNLPEPRQDFDLPDLLARTCVPEPSPDEAEEKQVKPLHWYSPEDISKIIRGLHSSGHITLMIRQGRIGAVKIGPRLWRVPEPEVERVAQGKLREPVETPRPARPRRVQARRPSQRSRRSR